MRLEDMVQHWASLTRCFPAFHRYLSLHDNKYIRYFPAHTKKVVTLCTSPVDDLFLSGSLDKTLRLWDLRSPNCQGFMQLNGETMKLWFIPTHQDWLRRLLLVKLSIHKSMLKPPIISRSTCRKLRPRGFDFRRWAQLRVHKAIRFENVRQRSFQYLQAEPRQRLRLDGLKILTRWKNHAHLYQWNKHSSHRRLQWKSAPWAHRSVSLAFFRKQHYATYFWLWKAFISRMEVIFDYRLCQRPSCPLGSVIQPRLAVCFLRFQRRKCARLERRHRKQTRSTESRAYHTRELCSV